MKPYFGPPVALWLLGSISCAPPAEAPPSEGAWWDGTELVWSFDGVELLRFPADGLALGTVGAFDPARSYDPVYPDAVAWHDVQAATSTTFGGKTWVELDYGDGLTASLTVTPGASGEATATLVPGGGPNVAYVRLSPLIDVDEGIYGLGEYFDSPDSRGRVRQLQIELDPTLETFYNEAHVPVPLAIGTTGWGLFVADRHPMVVDAAAADPERLTWTIGLGPEGPAGLTFHLFAAAHPLDVTAAYWRTTGEVTLPDRWAYGPLIWRDENLDQAQVEADAQELRDRDLPASGLWIDRPYASGVNTFDFDPSRFPDPAAMVEAVHDLGFRLGLWHTPYVSPDEAPDLDAEAVENGYYPPSTSINLNGWGTPIDFSDPAAVAWWQDLLARYTVDLGIEGFKLDYGEDIAVGAAGGSTAWTFEDGSDARTMHKVYPMLYHQTYAAMLPATGGFLLCRAGTWGDQVNARVIWPGDLDANLSRHRDVLTDENGEYVTVGGLHAAIVAGLSLGPSGFPFYASDTGGYRRSPPDAETFLRWTAANTVSSAMQVGNGESLQPWEILDETQLGWYRAFTRLHLRLFPTTWTYASRKDRPILRPLGLAFPELRDAPSEAYLLGDWLLVHPVVDAGATTREVHLPAGRWIDWFTGEILEGSAVLEVDAPLDRLPLHLAEGGIVPLLRPTIDTLSPTNDASIESYDRDPGVLTVRVFPGPVSSFTLFDGAVVHQDVTLDAVALEWTDGSEFDAGALFEVVGIPSASSVTLDDAALPVGDPDLGTGWSWDGVTARIPVPPGQHEVWVSFE